MSAVTLHMLAQSIIMLLISDIYIKLAINSVYGYLKMLKTIVMDINITNK